MAMSNVMFGSTIPLSTLIDFIVQKTYHDLTVLSELLPRKSDMDRKIEIAIFAKRTQQLFVRLLALVKWANSASKVDKCVAMSEFLDRHNMFFVDTADKLFLMAKNTLLQARLPCFSLPCAIDVLTTGTYSRLPACIKEKIIPPDPITEQDKKQVLSRISQVIEHRLVVSEIPRQMRVPVIYNGRVRFHVDNEFKVTMTLMGDNALVPWRLLDVTILVEDPEIGEGKSLVHPLQLNYVHQLVQSRLCESEQPLVDLYCCLHSFCLSLQLEVLQTQAYRLVQQRFGDNLWLESYIPGTSLDLSYWRDSSRREGKHGIHMAYKLSIHIDETNQELPLQVSHFPQILGSEGTRVAQTIKSDVLSLEKLLTHTIHVRSMARLRELQHELSLFSPAACSVTDIPTVLSVPILHPCLPSEMLSVAVSNTRGSFIVSMVDIESETVRQIEATLNGDHHELRQLLSNLRLELCLHRIRKSLQLLAGVRIMDQLPMVDAENHDVKKLGKSTLFVRYARHKDICLVIQVCPEGAKAVSIKYHLLHFEDVAVNEEIGAPAGAADSSENVVSTSKAYIRPRELIELNSVVCVDFGHGYAVEPVEDTHEALQRKRKLLLGDKDDTPLPGAKKAKSATGFVPEVYYVVAFCDDQLAHMLLAQQLRRENVVCSGPELEDRTSIVKIFRLPECVDICRKANALLANNLLSCSIRLNSGITSNIWQCEMKFAASPLAAWTASSSNHLPLQVELSRDKAVGDLLAQWTAIARLYEPVLKFATLYANAPATLQQSIRVSSYTFDTLTFAYGPNGGCFTMTVQYKVDEKSFQLTPASLWSSPNPHSITLRQLEHELNRTQCLFTVAQLLADTWSPLLALSRLVQLPLNASTTARQQVVLTFALTPLTASHVRLTFRHLYALDVHVQNGQCVTVRDGAYSFDHSRLVDSPLAPIQGLKGFLALYADSNSSITSVARRRSINDDQQPASPAVMDMLDSLITPFHQTGAPKPTGGPIPSPAYDPSSPSTSQKAASSASLQQYPSPIGAGFPLASPPGIHAPSPSAPSPSTQSSVGAHVPSSPSNFAAMASPAAPMSVGSQSQLRASAPRSWTVPSFPTVLSQDAFYRLLTSSTATGAAALEPALGSPLERFLGSALLRRHLQRYFQSDESHHFKRFSQGDLSSANNAAMKFGTESLQCEVALSLDHQSLHLSLQPAEHSAWDPADLDVLQKFFATQVTCPPYQTNALTSFCRLLAMPHILLRDCVRLMRLEMTNDATLRWRLRWCLTIPHGMAPQLPIGSAAVICKEKFFFVMQLTRQDQQFGGGVASGPDLQVLLLPITYHMKSGMIQAPEKTTSMHIALTVNTILKRALQVQSQYVSNPADISLFEVIRFLLQNLEL